MKLSYQGDVIANELPDWWLFMEKIGAWMQTQKGVYVCAVCPDDIFSAYAVACSLTNLNENIHELIKLNPYVVIDKRKAIYMGDITEYGQLLCQFHGHDTLIHKVPVLDIEKRVTPCSYEGDMSSWCSKNKKNLDNKRISFTKKATLIGNKALLLRTANNINIEDCSLGSKIYLEGAKGVYDDGANIKIKSSTRVCFTKVI